MQQNQPANFEKPHRLRPCLCRLRRGHGQHLDVPYRVGQYGGAAFLLIYFGFVALFGWVGLSGEFAFGRLTGTGPIGSYAYALRSRGKKGGGKVRAPFLCWVRWASPSDTPSLWDGWCVTAGEPSPVHCLPWDPRNISGGCRRGGGSAACCGTAWWSRHGAGPGAQHAAGN